MIIGIDSGITGAITFYDPAKQYIEVFDVPTKQFEVAGKTKAGNKKKRREIDMGELYKILINLRSKKVYQVVIEKVHASPTDGAVQGFNFGKVYGQIVGMCYGLQFNVAQCSPQAWKREFNLIGTDKEAARQLAIEIWGADYFKLKKHHNRADSALIAAYGHKVLTKA